MNKKPRSRKYRFYFEIVTATRLVAAYSSKEYEIGRLYCRHFLAIDDNSAKDRVCEFIEKTAEQYQKQEEPKFIVPGYLKCGSRFIKLYKPADHISETILGTARFIITPTVGLVA